MEQLLDLSFEHILPVNNHIGIWIKYARAQQQKKTIKLRSNYKQYRIQNKIGNLTEHAS
jgi:hypothetical protein